MVVEEARNRKGITALLPAASGTIALTVNHVSKVIETMMRSLPVEGGAS